MMSLTASQRNEIERIVAAATAGDADEQHRGLLDGILRENADARTFYLQLIELQTSLAWRGGVPRPGAEPLPGPLSMAIAKAMQAEVRVVDERFGESPSAPSVAVPHRYSRIVWGSGIAAAAVVLCAVMTFTFSVKNDRSGSQEVVKNGADNLAAPVAATEKESSHDKGELKEIAAVAVARLTGTWDALWTGDGSNNKSGQALAPGQRLELAGGLAEVTFECGAIVIVQAPAVFEVRSAHGGTLERGRLTARVPGPWAKFWVQTPQAKVFDLGTEFGIATDADGASQVRVFEGAVEVEPNQANESNQSKRSRQLLTAGQAGRIEDSGDVQLPGSSQDPSSAYVRSMPNSLVEDFVRSIQTSRPWGYWSFNSVITSTLVPDVSGHGYFGQLYGDAMVVQGGSIMAIGQAASFQGPGDSVVVPTGTSLSLQGDFTLEALFRTNMGGVLISKTPSDGAWKPGSKILFIRGGEVRFTPFEIGKSRKGSRSLNAKVLVNDNRWHHVVLTNRANVNGKRDRTIIYVDGVERVRREDWDITSSDDRAMPIKLGVGAESYPTKDVLRSAYFPTRNNLIGHIDEAAVYDRCLAIEEVDAHYRAYLTAGIARRGMSPPVTNGPLNLSHVDETLDVQGQVAD